ncbi:hypothetical protein [Streptomyces sp. SP18CS02]|uniref:hypothetical protein n=1 Tax=Streptomyces sp. SP18CS02 TaxID=3002531 RepID=UPI002E78545A|nr:hypothetical protein [Streptomyces sp. SP18CS02]MEE1757496.1 hypothetical protein [Streptomyces sp. SP18CS02]
MEDKRLEGPGENGSAVPRDMPDEQAGSGPDPWDGDLAEASEASEEGESGDGATAGEEAVPDETAPPQEDPVPDEPTG